MITDEHFFHEYSLEELSALENSFDYKFYSNEMLLNIRRIVKYFKFINDIKYSYHGTNYKGELITSKEYLDDEDEKNVRLLIDLGFDSIYNIFKLMYLIDDVNKSCENNNIDKLYEIILYYAQYKKNEMDSSNELFTDTNYMNVSGSESVHDTFAYVKNISNIEILFKIFEIELKKRFIKENKLNEYCNFITNSSEIKRFMKYIINVQIDYANRMYGMMKQDDFNLVSIPFEEKKLNKSSEDEE